MGGGAFYAPPPFHLPLKYRKIIFVISARSSADRVSGFGPEGRRFESYRAHQTKKTQIGLFCYTKHMEIKNRHKHLEHLIGALDKIYGRPSEIFKRGFLLGIAAGMGWIIGATFIVLLLGFMISKLGGVPFLGEILEKINNAVPIR